MKLLLYYFLFLVSLLSLLASGVMDSQDGLQYLATARNIYYSGKPTSPPYEYPEKNIHMGVYTGKDGNTYSAVGLGYSLALVPAVAVTDIFYKIYHIKPAVHFPLENDWLILLLGSLTNIFFAAGLGVIMYLYFIETNLTKKQAFILSLITLFATNLFVYSKHSFAHMMFITFLVLAFYLIKKYAGNNQRKYLIFAGAAYGATALSYNASFILTFPSLIIYYLLLKKTPLKLTSLKSLFTDSLNFFIGTIPFLIPYLWYEHLRNSSQLDYVNFAADKLAHVPVSMFIEGLYGQLLSPGRSIFIYSPVLVIIIFFWHKIKANVLPELTALTVMALLYIPFLSIQVVWGDGGSLGTYGYTALWHGEASWGPRYLLPLIPFGLIIVGNIYSKLKIMQKILIFYPLVIIGLYIELLGVIVPYQIKNYNLEKSFHVNKTEFTNYIYSDLIPRYTPILSMSKNLITFTNSFPKTLDHGKYNVRLYDGITIPFNVGQERWRAVENNGYISFDNLSRDPVKKISFGIINHPLKVSSSSAALQLVLNGHPLFDEQPVLKPTERRVIEAPVNAGYLKDKSNQLEIIVTYNPPLKDLAQTFSMIAFYINNYPVNLESIDLPYYSPLGPAMVGAKYNTYGGQITDPWRFWDIHTQVYEKTPDFWWAKAIYYWDYPQKTILLIVLSIVASTVFFSYKLFTHLKKMK